MNTTPMSSHSAQKFASSQSQIIELEESDLPAFCPNSKTPLWSMHPRVYLDLAHSETVACPYCSSAYRLKLGIVLRGH